MTSKSLRHTHQHFRMHSSPFHILQFNMLHTKINFHQSYCCYGFVFIVLHQFSFEMFFCWKKWTEWEWKSSEMKKKKKNAERNQKNNDKQIQFKFHYYMTFVFWIRSECDNIKISSQNKSIPKKLKKEWKK